MKIASGLTKLSEVSKLIECGADELYCGMILDKWSKNYTNIACTNKRESLSHNFSNIQQFKEAIELAHSFNVPVSLTLNSPFYSPKQYILLMKDIEKAIKAGIDSFIVSDIALINYLKEKGVNTALSASSLGTTFNSETAKLYADFGIKRIILPRHLTIEEIKSIVDKNPSIEFECFILNCKCSHTEGYCTFQHGFNEVLNPIRAYISSIIKNQVSLVNKAGRLFSPGLLKYLRSPLIFGHLEGCWLAYNIRPFYKNLKPIKSVELKKNLEKRIESVFKKLTQPACGACAIYDLDKIGITTLKIVGREYTTKKKTEDLTFIKSCLNLLNNKRITRELFASRTKNLFFNLYKSECVTLRCYYPELYENTKQWKK
ncbi:MAG: U32 family peptidase [Nanoarchaeota archaeon]